MLVSLASLHRHNPAASKCWKMFRGTYSIWMQMTEPLVNSVNASSRSSKLTAMNPCADIGTYVLYVHLRYKMPALHK